MFLRAVVLPRVSAALHAKVTAKDLDLSPFSQLTARGLNVTTIGTDPLVTVDELRIRYNLFAILSGSFEVSEVSVLAPVIRIVTLADGTRNLDPLLAGTTHTPEPADQPKESSPLWLRNISIQKGSIELLTHKSDGSQERLALNGLTVSLQELKTGKPSNLNISSDLQWKNADSLIVGNLKSTLEISLDSALFPDSIVGTTRLDIARAEGAYADLASLSGSVQTDWTPKEIRSLKVQIEKGGTRSANLQINGPFDIETTVGRLNLSIDVIDRQILKLAGAYAGLDFANGTLSATNRIELSNGGNVIALNGNLLGNQIALNGTAAAAPSINLDTTYALRVDLKNETALVQTLDLKALENTTPMLRLMLEQPMSLSWGAKSDSVPDATLQLSLDGFKLDSWSALLGTNLPSGTVSLKGTLKSEQNGKRLSTELAGRIDNLNLEIGTDKIEQAQVTIQCSGTFDDLSAVRVSAYQIEMTKKGKSLASSVGSLRYSLPGGELNLTNNTKVSLPEFLSVLNIPELNLASGLVTASSSYSQIGSEQKAVGTLQLANLTGSYSGKPLENLGTAIEFDLEMTPERARIQKLNISLRNGDAASGSLAATGEYQFTDSATRLAFEMNGINQSVLAPFLNELVAPAKLLSVSLHGKGTATYNPKGKSEVQAIIGVDNFEITRSSDLSPAPRMSSQLQVDGSLEKETLDVRRFALKLSPTERASNELVIQGRLDLNPTNSRSNQISVRSEALDLTPFYELFAESQAPKIPSETVLTPERTQQPAPPPSAPMPFHQLAADVQFKRLFLKEIAITDLILNAGITNGQVTLAHAGLTLNGAPITAKAILNLGLPEFQYEIDFDANRVPIEPIANSFTTNAPGQFKGELIAKARMKGAGLDGGSLQKSLDGQVSLSATNLNLQLVGPKTKRILEPIALVLRIPELTQTPLNWFSVSAAMGGGEIKVQRLAALSHAFYAEGQGNIRIARILTNSPISIPIDIALRRSLAAKSKLLPPNTPEDVAYVPLPQFAKLTGTLGEPDTDINKFVVSGLVLRSAVNIPQVGENTGNLLQGIGNLLSGQAPQGTLTNLPAKPLPAEAKTTNAPSKFNPLDLLKLIPKKSE